METTDEFHKKVKLNVLLEAFKNDCIMILKRFSIIENGCYEDFVRLWVELGFGLCTVLHKSVNKVCIFNEHCLEVAKDLFLIDDSQYKKIGALYLLYTLYGRQRIRFGNCIKVTLDEFKIFSSSLLALYEEGFDEAKQIFLQLNEFNAFDFMISGEVQVLKHKKDDTVDPNGDEVDPTCDEVDPSGDKVDPSGEKVDPSDGPTEEKITFMGLAYDVISQYKESLNDVANTIESDFPQNLFKKSMENLDKNIDTINCFLNPPISELFKADVPEKKENELLKRRVSLKQNAKHTKHRPKHTISSVLKND